jgi:hypothetical protein
MEEFDEQSHNRHRGIDRNLELQPCRVTDLAGVDPNAVGLAGVEFPYPIEVVVVRHPKETG